MSSRALCSTKWRTGAPKQWTTPTRKRCARPCPITPSSRDSTACERRASICRRFARSRPHILRVKPPAEGFGSQDRRFKYVGEHPFPGPGHYPPGNQIGSNPSINRGVAAGLGFASSEKRDDETIRLNEKESVPGPGTYDTSGEWVQKSYNQIFNPNVLRVTS